MKENLVKLYNTLALVEVRGESVKNLAACMQFVEQLVKELDAKEAKSANAN